MCAKPVKNDPKTPETTGHVWDGIEELNNPLPRWWVWVFYLTIIWGIAYTIAYPAWPLISGATPGVMGASTRADVAAEIKRIDDGNAAIKAKLVSADLASVAKDPDLNQFAMKAGKATFNSFCVQCHGREGGGNKASGYPTLSDNDWLWGGDLETIHTTIAHGIRNTTDPEARYSEMPRFGLDELLTKDQIAAVVEYVLQMSKQDHDAALAVQGQAVFTTDDTCTSCHGVDGKGNRELGAPDLTDAIWLYGGSRETITKTVTQARFGVMPAWGTVADGGKPRLTEDQIRAVTIYVHALGGNK
jgi:cytochrome c oxidase cbb3-type subunit III